MATPSPEGSSCKEPGSRRICSFGETSVGITFPLTLAGFATIGVLPSLLYVPIEEKARAPSRFKATHDALRSSKPAIQHDLRLAPCLPPKTSVPGRTSRLRQGGEQEQ